ncbi:uncharacterized protein EKO05_0006570 [Ascochyta rabiei]|uniref:GmrSD restriction endonucleases N-terminal domain-containing protein n=1 Tax=Didymella rabiei TaxID=5454 RepID=A0A162W297_DIDRA|nr:uncharacterized protein EKO05_0006570 [Ascochyta rabiei]KZM18745.1 hypothetical protein ST47_g10071 [Ascochyta rabiei]UPX16153.1 hypothetical protein EKO05_0006570 [Ascochyta rabiei]
MEINQTSARPPRPADRAKHDAAPQPIIKQEDVEDETYRPRPQLPQPVVLMRNLGYLMSLMESGVIDVDPVYQREVVWTADRMTGLIDSLMENYYIPPIILNQKPRLDQDAAAPQETLVCVDGKQRLSSVLMFIKGLIPCHDYRGEKWWFCEPAGSKRKRVLSTRLQRQFYRKEFVSFEFGNLSPKQEEDLFARVQMGVQLNLAEKMRASTGPWQEIASIFVKDFPTVYSLMKDRARSKDFQLTLSCFSQIVECMHPTNANGVPILKTNHTHLPKLLSNKSAVDDGLKSHLASVWVTFRDLIEADPNTFTNGNKYLRGVQTFAPVEMVAVAVLISTHSETRNNSLLLGDIRAMRTAVRESFVDLRLNASVWKWFWEYIEELEGIRGAIDGSTINRKTTKLPKTSVTASTGGSTAAAITAAAAAPKKGRITARTKRPVVTVAEEAPVGVKQEPGVSAMPGARSFKRQRTGDSSLEQLEAHTLSESPPSTDKAQFPADLPLGYMRSKPELPPMLTHASAQSHPPVNRRKPARETPTFSPPLDIAPIPVIGTQSRFSQTLLPAPTEARQQRVSELNSYQSSHRSPAVSQPPVPTAPMFSSADGFDLRGESDYPQTHQDYLQPGGLIGSEVPSGLPPRPRLTQQTQNLVQHSKQGVDEATIDLNSDTEQERQSLLSAFRIKPSTGELTERSSGSGVKPTTHKQGFTARTSSQDLPTRENNPYAKFKSPGAAP